MFGGLGGGGFPANNQGKKQKGPHLKPQLLVCYLCGQQFGSSSLGIHVPQCYTKKTKQWEAGDPETRGKKPRHPDTVDWQASTTMTKEEYNDKQFQDFSNNLEPCPHCGRKFLPDRLVVHLRSCNPGASGGGSKPVGFRPQSQQSNDYARAQTSNGRIGGGGGGQGGGGRVGGEGGGGGETAKANPFRNRLPNSVLQNNANSKGLDTDGSENDTVGYSTYNPSSGNGASSPVSPLTSSNFGGAGRSPGAPSPTKNKFSGKSRSCIRCSCVEYDASAKFCRDCGTVLDLETMDKCDSCGEPCPSDARFCPTCGNAFKDASAPDRTLKMEEPSKLVAGITAAIGGVRGGGGGGRGSEGGGGRGGGNAGPRPQIGGSSSANGPSRGDEGRCPNCGCDVPEDGNFCDNCGCRLGVGQQQPHQQQQQQQSSPSPASASNGNKGKLTETPTKEVIHMRCDDCNEVFEDDGARFCEECGGPLRETRVRLKVKTWADDAQESMGPAGETVNNNNNNSKSRGNEDDDYEARGSSEPRPRPPAVPNKNAAPSRGGGGGGGGSGGGYHRPSFDAQQHRSSVDDDNGDEFPAGAEEQVERGQCRVCQRYFALDVLQRHEDFCQKQRSKSRKVFDSRKNRMQGTDSEGFIRVVSQREREEASRPHTAGASLGGGGGTVSKWKQQSLEFRKAMQDARKVDSILKAGGTAKDLPPPTYSDNSHLTPCPHCGRRFAAETAARHIPSCANTINRPKGPPVRRR